MDDLIERSELRKEFCNMCEAMQPEMIDCEKKGCMSMQIIDEQPAVNSWIPCSERLPERNVEVIVAIYGSDIVLLEEGETVIEAIRRQNRTFKKVTIAYIDDDGCWNGADLMPLIVHPTFWMQKPEAPEKV